MTVGTGLVFPGIAPVGAGTNDGKRRVGNGGFAAGGFEQHAAIISGAQPAQAELGGGEVVDASAEVGQVGANRINLERQRLVAPVQEMGVGANAGVRVLGGFVIGPSSFRIAVVSHGSDELGRRSFSDAQAFKSALQLLCKIFKQGSY